MSGEENSNFESSYWEKLVKKELRNESPKMSFQAQEMYFNRFIQKRVSEVPHTDTTWVRPFFDNLQQCTQEDLGQSDSTLDSPPRRAKRICKPKKVVKELA